MRHDSTRFGPNRYGYAFEKIKASGSKRHLDIGCFDGSWIAEISAALNIEVHGADVNKDAIQRGEKRYPTTTLHHIRAVTNLPFSNEEFDSITLMDVYEHLDACDQAGVLLEIRRLLRPGGLLVITVPGKHLFSFLDIGNLKFRFPRLHRLYIKERYGVDFYNSRYANNPHGLFGDVSARKRWHEHFKAQQLVHVLQSAEFDIVDVDGAGYFMRLISMLTLVPSKLVHRLASWLMTMDYRTFASANVFVTCTHITARR